MNNSSESRNSRTHNGVVIYNGVIINEQVVPNNRHVHTNGIIYNVKFDTKHPSVKRVNWVRSKRLLFGSLVCLISDDFEEVLFATVHDRKIDMLKDGCIQLCFEGNERPIYDRNNHEKYRMIESSSAYFMAYRHILERLKDMKEETMPFKNYILFCEHEIEKVIF